ncbi:MAG: dockerin type I repeat-containing protein [Oscillospiraceae bacterium]|nr:dockerin type I repeat-containing protein [Oscillospiraceae bacterium]
MIVILYPANSKSFNNNTEATINGKTGHIQIQASDVINYYLDFAVPFGNLTGSVTISPSSPHAGDTLTANLSGTVASIPANKIHYQWQKDMSEDGGFYRDIAGETNKTFNIPLTDTSGYSKYRVKVTADYYDGELRSDSVRVAEGQPTLTGTVTVTPSSPKAGNTLTADFTGTLATLPAYRIHYQWQFSAGEGAVWKDIAAGTSRDYTTASNTPTGRNYRVMVTADGYDGAVYSNVVILSNPLTGTVTISPTNPKQGDTLTANPGGGLNSIPASRYHYQWQRVGLVGKNYVYTDISGATGKTYTVTEAAGTMLCIKITADGYVGEIRSNRVTVSAGGSSYPKGDVDRSGQVGNSDLIMVARHVVHILTLTGEQFTLGDMNDDKVIDNKDIISVARKVVGL